jgi:hypothetical protein
MRAWLELAAISIKEHCAGEAIEEPVKTGDIDRIAARALEGNPCAKRLLVFSFCSRSTNPH